ncbi:hypothetical protein SPSIL_006560 [Sporomusa silvacetica DSM 10669]|uniref:Dinitrogenase iron-molybdenum cofactor biosynthesis domain-containing protein n=1 Tax=Sporomusa silvacetica DSM 10669 TaxID=1123289 RepID=A0ABZ3IFU3_9FIRM|nr:NifB/NifX family molybdenum-iron cluster-binding protein [Sporomusa silvacetica]OZC17018.1 dinitrogenase iron-molybdenum cofactor [Sporomusa silvacetica DSM 10669]
MKIAVLADGCDYRSKVTEKFVDARWLLIVDMDQQRICEAIEKNEGDTENKDLAKNIIDRDCESVICGEINKVPFEILADQGVTRSLGNGLIVADAVRCEYMLELITDYIGGQGCSSESHHTGTCDCEHDACN